MRSGTREVADSRAIDRDPAGATAIDPGAGAWWADDTEPEASERITLIEFTWLGLTGAQPVIFVAREFLQ